MIDRPGRDEALGYLGNVVWLVLGGIWLAIFHVLLGLVLCITECAVASA